MASLVFRRGDVAKYSTTLFKADGNPLDLTGATVWMTVKPAYGGATDDADAIFKWYWVSGGASSGLSVPSPTTGIVKLKVTHADTVGKPVGVTWVYDVQVLLPETDGNNVYTWDEGTVKLIDDVTQRVTVP